MPPKQSLSNMHWPIPLVGEVEGVVMVTGGESRILVCPTVAQQWVDRYQGEHPGEANPRVVAYGAYLLVLRVVYGIRRHPRTPWSQVWCRETLAMWLVVFRDGAVAQRARRHARLTVRDQARLRRVQLAVNRTVPYLYRTPPEPWDAGPAWGVVFVRCLYERVEFRPEVGAEGVLGICSTRHLGFEVRDTSGREGHPTASPLIAETTLGTCYHVMVVEFDMGRRPQWVFTTEVGQPHTYGRLLMPDPPVVPYLEWLDT